MNIFREKRWLIVVICVLFFFWINERMLATQLVSLYTDQVGIGYQCGMVLMLIAFLYCAFNIKLLPSLKSTETKTFILLMVYINLISFVIAALRSDMDHSMFLGLAPPFLYYLMFGLSQRNDIGNYTALAMTIVLVSLFVSFKTSLTMLAELRQNSDGFEGGSAGYFILLMIPFVLCCKWKIIHYLAFLIAFAVILLSTKRGGVVGVVLMTIGYLYVNSVIDRGLHHKVNKPMKITLITVFLIGVAFLIMESHILNDVAVFEKFEETRGDGGSGRTSIWAEVLEMIFNSNILNFFVGHGYGAVVLDSPYHLSAHNDFLETFYDYGFVGFSLLLAFISRIILFARKLIKRKSIFAAPMAASIILFLTISTISHNIIYFANMSIFAVFWGYIAGNARK